MRSAVDERERLGGLRDATAFRARVPRGTGSASGQAVPKGAGRPSFELVGKRATNGWYFEK